jgi:hypothetical protein
MAKRSAHCFYRDHFVTRCLCKTLCTTPVIHDQFVSEDAITLSREAVPCRDQFVTQSYS